MPKKQVGFRLSEYHLSIIDEAQAIYKLQGFSYSKAEVVELALNALIKQPVTLHDEMVDNVYFRMNVQGLVKRNLKDDEE